MPQPIKRKAECLCLSPDGHRVAYSTGKDSRIDVFDVTSGKLTRILTSRDTDPPYIHRLQFTPDGKGIIFCGLDRSPRKWDLESGKAVDLYKESIDGFRRNVGFAGRQNLGGSSHWEIGSSVRCGHRKAAPASPRETEGWAAIHLCGVFSRGATLGDRRVGREFGQGVGRPTRVKLSGICRGRDRLIPKERSPRRRVRKDWRGLLLSSFLQTDGRFGLLVMMALIVCGKRQPANSDIESTMTGWLSCPVPHQVPILPRRISRDRPPKSSCTTRGRVCQRCVCPRRPTSTSSGLAWRRQTPGGLMRA